MDRNIHRADMKGFDPFDLSSGKIREGDIVPHQETQPCVVILEVQRFPHSRRKLIDEAEDAAVDAGPRRIHQVAFEVQSEISTLVLDHVERIPPSLRGLHDDLEFLIIGEVFIIENIPDNVPVD